MALSQLQVSILGLGAAVLLATQNIDTRAQAQIAASNTQRTTTGDPITGEGLPNPAPVVTRNWGELPAGRKWGTTAGIDIDPDRRQRLGLRALRRGNCRRRSRRLRQHAARSHLQVRSQDRCGAREFRQGRHGDAARHRRGQAGQRVDCRFRGQQGRHQGASGPQVQPEGREAAEPRHRRQARQRRRPVQPAERRRRRPRRQHLRGRRTRRAGHDHRERRSPRASSAAPRRASASSRPTASSSSRGGRSACVTASSARRTRWRSTREAACGWPIAATTASRSSIRTERTSSRATCSAAPAASSSGATRST